MDRETNAFFFGIFIGLFVGALSSFFFTGNVARDEAVKNNAAEYYLDKHHQKQFRWITNDPTNSEEPIQQ